MARDRDDDRDDRDDDRPRRRDRDDDDRPRGRDRDDDRPRRRDRDDDDRPRRSYRRDDDAPPVKQASVLGIFGLIASIVAVIMSVIPCIGVFAFIPAGIALLKSVIALIMAKVSQGRVGSGIPLAGTIVSGVAILIAVIQVVLLGVYAKSLPTTPSPSLTTPADVTITAVQLDTEYEQNTIAADAKYKGKLVQVTGVVFRVTDEVKRFRLTVELNGTPGSTVDCDFDTSDKASLTALTPGVTTTIRGKCIGRRTVDGDKWVTLEKCVIVPPESKTNPTPTSGKGTPTVATPTTPATGTKGTGPKPGDGAQKLMASILAREFAGNEAATAAKYEGKVIEVTGVVFETDTGGDEWLVYLGRSGKEVECQFKMGAAGVEALSAKATITVRGKCVGLDGKVVVLEDCTLVK